MNSKAEEMMQKVVAQRQACFDMLQSVGCTEHEAHKYKNALMHRLLLSGWYLGKEVSRDTILDHLERGVYGRPSIKQIESDPSIRQMIRMQDREPPPVANEGGGGVSWDQDRGRR